MIINCLTCGKAITTKRDLCPYCKMEISEFTGHPGIESAETLKERLKGTILSLVVR